MSTVETTFSLPPIDRKKALDPSSSEAGSGSATVQQHQAAPLPPVSPGDKQNTSASHLHLPTVPSTGISSRAPRRSFTTPIGEKVDVSEASSRKMLEQDQVVAWRALWKESEAHRKGVVLREALSTLMDEEDVSRYILHGQLVCVLCKEALKFLPTLEQNSRADIIASEAHSWGMLLGLSDNSRQMSRYSIPTMKKLQQWWRSIALRQVGRHATKLKIRRDVERHRHEKRLAKARIRIHDSVEESNKRCVELEERATDWMLAVDRKVSKVEMEDRNRIEDEEKWSAEALARDLRFHLVEFVLQPKLGYLQRKSEPSMRCDIEWQETKAWFVLTQTLEDDFHHVSAKEHLLERCEELFCEIAEEEKASYRTLMCETLFGRYELVLSSEGGQVLEVIQRAHTYTNATLGSRTLTLNEDKLRSTLYFDEHVNRLLLGVEFSHGKEYSSWKAFRRETFSQDFLQFHKNLCVLEYRKTQEKILFWQEEHHRLFHTESFSNYLFSLREDCAIMMTHFHERYQQRLPFIVRIQRWVRALKNGDIGRSATLAHIRMDLQQLWTVGSVQKSREAQRQEFLQIRKELMKEEQALRDEHTRKHDTKVKELLRNEILKRREAENDESFARHEKEADFSTERLNLLKTLISRLQRHAEYGSVLIGKDEESDRQYILNNFNKEIQTIAACTIQRAQRTKIARETYKDKVQAAMEHATGRGEMASRDNIITDEAFGFLDIQESFSREQVELLERIATNEGVGRQRNLIQQLNTTHQTRLSIDLDEANLRTLLLDDELSSWEKLLQHTKWENVKVFTVLNVESSDREQLIGFEWSGRTAILSSMETQRRRDILSEELLLRRTFVLVATEERWRAAESRKQSVAFSSIVVTAETEFRSSLYTSRALWLDRVHLQWREFVHRLSICDLANTERSISIQQFEQDRRQQIMLMHTQLVAQRALLFIEGKRRLELVESSDRYFAFTFTDWVKILRFNDVEAQEKIEYERLYFDIGTVDAKWTFCLEAMTSSLGPVLQEEETLWRCAMSNKEAEARVELLGDRKHNERKTLEAEHHRRRLEIMSEQVVKRGRISAAFELRLRDVWASVIQRHFRTHSSRKKYKRLVVPLLQQEEAIRENIEKDSDEGRCVLVDWLERIRRSGRRQSEKVDAAVKIQKSWKSHNSRIDVQKRKNVRLSSAQSVIAKEESQAATVIASAFRGKLARIRFALIRDSLATLLESNNVDIENENKI